LASLALRWILETRNLRQKETGLPIIASSRFHLLKQRLRFVVALRTEKLLGPPIQVLSAHCGLGHNPF
jgi:hypothetical protein